MDVAWIHGVASAREADIKLRSWPSEKVDAVANLVKRADSRTRRMDISVVGVGIPGYGPPRAST